MPEDRRHIAILFSDIVSYTSLMGEDEDKALDLLARNRTIHENHIKQFNGTLIKDIGDAILASFSLASDAVRCSIEIQKSCKKDNIPLKIGIHEGEVVFKDSDVFGDGVNIASRIQSETQQGCINISGAVYRDVKNKHDIQTKFIKDKKFKNVDEPIKVYKILCEGEDGYHGTTETKPNKIKSKKLYYITPAILVVVMAILFVWKSIPFNQIVEVDKSIAVMPFDNESADDDNIYFVNGMMEDIRNNLSKIGDIRVISKTSTEKYRDTNLSTSEIGKELNVSYLLEGTVQKLGNQVKIHAQLISVENDDHIWQDTYERDISDVTKVFKVQSDIAKIIASELNVSITPDEKQDIESFPTSNLTAYDYYLKGEEYRLRNFKEQDLRFAIQMYEKAIENDPNFALAWVGLAAVSRMYYFFYYDRSDEQLLKTKQYVDKAVSLSPQSKEVMLEEGRYYYMCRDDYPKALQIFEKLKIEYPYEDDLYFYFGMVYRRMGELRKSQQYIDHAISLNPSNWNHWLQAGNTSRVLREYNEAEKHFKKVIDLNPSTFRPYMFLLNLYSVTGDVKKAKQFLKNNKEHINKPAIKLVRGYIEILDGNYEEAIQITASLSDDAISEYNFYYSKHLQLGLIYYIMSNEKMVVKHFEAERIFLEEKIKELNDDQRLYSSLGIVYAGLGNKSKAIEAGRKAVEIRGLNKDAYFGFYREMDMAKILLMVGEYEEAIAKLEFLLSQNGSISIELLKLDPFWNPIKEMDGFKAIINNPEYQVNLSDN